MNATRRISGCWPPKTMLERIQFFLDHSGAVPIPSRCPITGDPRCLRNSCHHYRPDLFTIGIGERCAHCDAVAAAVDRQQRELDFHAATDTLDWSRAEQLALAALQDRELTEAQRAVWRERLDVASRKTGG